MNDQDLRAMVRDSIARQLGQSGTVRLQPETPYGDVRGVRLQPSFGEAQGGPEALEGPELHRHAAFVRLPLASGDDDGACLIEPSVRCNHCGYCQSFGH